MLKVQNLKFTYPKAKTSALEDFNLKVEKGGVYGLLGYNGAGKSTLLYLISGLLTPQEGSVEFFGENTRRRLPSTQREIMLVPEEFELPDITLEEFVRINSLFYPSFSEQDMQDYLELFEIERSLKIKIKRLSMGQKKKVMLSFALACNTRLVLLDEPTNGLDIPAKRAFRKAIARTASDDRIFIISTHQVRDIASILDNILIINQTRVVFNESVADIQSRLKFTDTSSKEKIDNALYAIKGIGGASVILPNDDGNDSEIDLEVLFDFAMNDTEILNDIFRKTDSHESDI